MAFYIVGKFHEISNDKPSNALLLGGPHLGRPPTHKITQNHTTALAVAVSEHRTPQAVANIHGLREAMGTPRTGSI
jgi:hypothetical protein